MYGGNGFYEQIGVGNNQNQNDPANGDVTKSRQNQNIGDGTFNFNTLLETTDIMKSQGGEDPAATNRFYPRALDLWRETIESGNKAEIDKLNKRYQEFPPYWKAKFPAPMPQAKEETGGMSFSAKELSQGKKVITYLNNKQMEGIAYAQSTGHFMRYKDAPTFVELNDFDPNDQYGSRKKIRKAVQGGMGVLIKMGDGDNAYYDFYRYWPKKVDGEVKLIRGLQPTAVINPAGRVIPYKGLDKPTKSVIRKVWDMTLTLLNPAWGATLRSANESGAVNLAPFSQYLYGPETLEDPAPNYQIGDTLPTVRPDMYARSPQQEELNRNPWSGGLGFADQLPMTFIRGVKGLANYLTPGDWAEPESAIRPVPESEADAATYTNLIKSLAGNAPGFFIPGMAGPTMGAMALEPGADVGSKYSMGEGLAKTGITAGTFAALGGAAKALPMVKDGALSIPNVIGGTAADLGLFTAGAAADAAVSGRDIGEAMAESFAPNALAVGLFRGVPLAKHMMNRGARGAPVVDPAEAAMRANREFDLMTKTAERPIDFTEAYTKPERPIGIGEGAKAGPPKVPSEGTAGAINQIILPLQKQLYEKTITPEQFKSTLKSIGIADDIANNILLASQNALARNRNVYVDQSGKVAEHALQDVAPLQGEIPQGKPPIEFPSQMPRGNMPQELPVGAPGAGKQGTSSRGTSGSGSLYSIAAPTIAVALGNLDPDRKDFWYSAAGLLALGAMGVKFKFKASDPPRTIAREIMGKPRTKAEALSGLEQIRKTDPAKYIKILDELQANQGEWLVKEGAKAAEAAKTSEAYNKALDDLGGWVGRAKRPAAEVAKMIMQNANSVEQAAKLAKDLQASNVPGVENISFKRVQQIIDYGDRGATGKAGFAPAIAAADAELVAAKRQPTPKVVESTISGVAAGGGQMPKINKNAPAGEIALHLLKYNKTPSQLIETAAKLNLPLDKYMDVMAKVPNKVEAWSGRVKDLEAEGYKINITEAPAPQRLKPTLPKEQGKQYDPQMTTFKRQANVKVNGSDYKIAGMTKDVVKLVDANSGETIYMKTEVFPNNSKVIKQRDYIDERGLWKQKLVSNRELGEPIPADTRKQITTDESQPYTGVGSQTWGKPMAEAEIFGRRELVPGNNVNVRFKNKEYRVLGWQWDTKKSTSMITLAGRDGKKFTMPMKEIEARYPEAGKTIREAQSTPLPVSKNAPGFGKIYKDELSKLNPVEVSGTGRTKVTAAANMVISKLQGTGEGGVRAADRVIKENFNEIYNMLTAGKQKPDMLEIGRMYKLVQDVVMQKVAGKSGLGLRGWKSASTWTASGKGLQMAGEPKTGFGKNPISEKRGELYVRTTKPATSGMEKATYNKIAKNPDGSYVVVPTGKANVHGAVAVRPALVGGDGKPITDIARLRKLGSPLLSIPFEEQGSLMQNIVKSSLGKGVNAMQKPMDVKIATQKPTTPVYKAGDRVFIKADTPTNELIASKVTDVLEGNRYKLANGQTVDAQVLGANSPTTKINFGGTRTIKVKATKGDIELTVPTGGVKVQQKITSKGKVQWSATFLNKLAKPFVVNITNPSRVSADNATAKYLSSILNIASATPASKWQFRSKVPKPVTHPWNKRSNDLQTIRAINKTTSDAVENGLKFKEAKQPYILNTSTKNLFERQFVEKAAARAAADGLGIKEALKKYGIPRRYGDVFIKDYNQYGTNPPQGGQKKKVM